MIRHGWLITLTCLLPLLAACGKKHEGWATFPVPIYADSRVMNDAPTRSDFEDAMRFWEEKAGRSLFDFKGQWDSGTPFSGSAENPSSMAANVLFFQNPWPFGGNIAGRTTVLTTDDGIQASIIMINPDTAVCTGDCRGATYRSSQRKIFTHELGHFLGMGHVEDQSNIMNPEVTPGGSLAYQQVDLGALRELTQGE